MKFFSKDWFAIDTVSAARGLLGHILECDGARGMIVETESYTTDEASHGRVATPRSELMRETFGHIYVYQTYGMYFCLNFTTDKFAPGAVLIRAIQPLSGIETMAKRRGVYFPQFSASVPHGSAMCSISSGPGRLCQALGITKSDSGLPIGRRIRVVEGVPVTPKRIGATFRVGITRDTHLPWRFFIKDNPFVSRG